MFILTLIILVFSKSETLLMVCLALIIATYRGGIYSLNMNKFYLLWLYERENLDTSCPMYNIWHATRRRFLYALWLTLKQNSYHIELNKKLMISPSPSICKSGNVFNRRLRWAIYNHFFVSTKCDSDKAVLIENLCMTSIEIRVLPFEFKALGRVYDYLVGVSPRIYV